MRRSVRDLHIGPGVRPVMSPSPSPAVRTLEIPLDDPSSNEPVPGSYLRRLRRAVAILMAAIAAHVWLVRAPQPPGHDARPIEVAGLQAPPVSRDVRVMVDVVTVRTASPIGTTGKDPVPVALRAAVDRSIAPSRSVAAPIPVATTALLTEAIEGRDRQPTPPGPRTADMPEAEHASVNTVEVKLPELRSDKPLITAALPLSVATAALPTRPVTESRTFEAAPDIQEQTQIVLEVLNRYTRSFETMDVWATKAVYPSVDDRALQKAYRALDSQQVRLSNCGVSIDGPDANARCRGSATYRQKVGSRTVHLNDLEWMFTLSRDDAGWQIVNANVRIR